MPSEVMTTLPALGGAGGRRIMPFIGAVAALGPLLYITWLGIEPWLWN
jgi:hypothetical protein